MCALRDAARASKLRLRLTTLDGKGRRYSIRDLAAAELGLEAGGYRWQARSDWRDAAACAIRGACGDLLSDDKPVHARYMPPRLVGCGFTGPRQVNRAAGAPSEVALTFDDGPSA